tara:strand:- start:2681 stop:3085 length:405 start_codon:yes stop_codon:yes gene_type:complete
MSLTSRTASLFILILLVSCGGSGLDGIYEGKIGSKNRVSIFFFKGNEAELKGYWSEVLNGAFQQSTLKGKTVDSIVFTGPEEKPFKLRICYEAKDGHLEILAIHSRIFGPGARYVPTEPSSTFADPSPKLYKLE